MPSSFRKSIDEFRKKATTSHNNIILHNRVILYIIFFISLANLFYLTVERDYISVLTFILIGITTSFFSKNMMIILFISIILTNILKYGSSVLQHAEGLKNNTKKKEEEKEGEPEEDDEKKIDTTDIVPKEEDDTADE